MGVYYERKVCSSFTCEELLSNIEEYNLSLKKILKTCLIIDGTELKNDISEEIFNFYKENKKRITILYFADILSAQTYMDIYNNHEIFPQEILSQLFTGLTGIYSPPMYVNESYLFHIFHGIIFSYDIKDIYGFIKEYRDKLYLFYYYEDNSDEKHKLKEQYENLTIINKDNFFELLSKIIDIIMQASPELSELCRYAYQIKNINIDGDPAQNFKTISME
jgi:hypothetical protein